MNCCDRCGAPGKARWFKDELELIFCGHHDHEYTKLLSEEWSIDLGFAYDANPELVNA